MELNPVSEPQDAQATDVAAKGRWDSEPPRVRYVKEAQEKGIWPNQPPGNEVSAPDLSIPSGELDFLPIVRSPGELFSQVSMHRRPLLPANSSLIKFENLFQHQTHVELSRHSSH